MRAVISPQVDLSAPGFDQAVCVTHSQWLAVFPAWKEVVILIRLFVGQVLMQSFVGGLVNDQDVVLACLLLPDPDGISRLDSQDILDLESQQVPDPQAVVYAQGKQEIFPGIVGKKFFN